MSSDLEDGTRARMRMLEIDDDGDCEPTAPAADAARVAEDQARAARAQAEAQEAEARAELARIEAQSAKIEAARERKDRQREAARERAHVAGGYRDANDKLYAATLNRYFPDRANAIDEMLAIAGEHFDLGERIDRGDGRYTWMLTPIATRDGREGTRGLHVSTYRMQSGRWEITAYIF